MLICRVLCIMAVHLHLALVCPKDIVPCGLSRGSFADLNHPAMFCYRDEAFSWTPFQKKLCLFSLLLTVLSWTLTCKHATEACRVWHVAVGFFAVSLSTARSEHRVNLLVHSCEDSRIVLIWHWSFKTVKTSALIGVLKICGHQPCDLTCDNAESSK